MADTIGHHVPGLSDTAAGVLAAGAGWGGLTLQIVTEFANLGVVFVNLLLAIGGLYLLWGRVQKARREARYRKQRARWAQIAAARKRKNQGE